MGRSARSTVEARFSEATMVDRYEGLMVDLARTGRAASRAFASGSAGARAHLMPSESVRLTPPVQRQHADAPHCAKEESHDA